MSCWSAACRRSHKYPGADHAFARLGGKTYSKPEADRALALSLEFFNKHLR